MAARARSHESESSVQEEGNDRRLCHLALLDRQLARLLPNLVEAQTTDRLGSLPFGVEVIVIGTEYNVGGLHGVGVVPLVVEDAIVRPSVLEAMRYRGNYA